MTTRLWPALAIRFTPSTSTERTAIEDLVSAALDDLHPTAIQERDAAWLAFFAKPEDRDRAAAALPAAVAGSIEVDAIDVADEDWARRSQQDLDAVRVGRIIIAPPWRAANASLLASAAPASTGTAPSVIVIQPSMGFGTGHHASTRLCTSLLQRLDLAGRTVLDVGTGSGVLALVARALGARAVVGVDDDPDAIESARENLDLNGGGAGIDLRLGDFRALSTLRADVVTANLTGGLLIRSADTLADAVAPGGALIISGVTLEEESLVLAAFAPRMTLVERVTEDEWMGGWLR